MTISTNKLINKLNAEFPNLNAVDSADFRGAAGGIWFRGSEDAHTDGVRHFDYWGNGTHPAIEDMLNDHGWFSEPNDPGTLLAWN